MVAAKKKKAEDSAKAMECSVAPEWWIVFFLEDKESNTTQVHNYIIVPCLYRPTVRNLRLVFFFYVTVCLRFEEVMDGRGRLGVL